MKRWSISVRAAVLAVFFTAVAGCATPIKRTAQEADAGRAASTALFDKLRAPHDRPSLVLHEGQYVDPTPVPIAAPAPPECQVQFDTKRPMTPDEFVQAMSFGECHISVRFTSDALAEIEGKPSNAAAGPVAPTPYGSGTTLPGVAGGPGASIYGGGKLIDVNYKGGLSGLLERVASDLGVYYKKSGADYTFYYYDTRTWHIDVDAGTTSQHSNVRSGTNTQASAQSSAGSSQNNSGDSGTTQVADVAYETNFRKDFEDTIKQILSPQGKMAYAPSSGLLVVHDTPDRLNAIDSIVSATNAFASKQVLLNFSIVTFSKTHKTNNALNWNAVFKDLQQRFGVNLATQFPVDSGAISAGVSILDTAKGALGQWSGSQAIISALEQQGSVHIVKKPSMFAMNGQPTPQQNGVQTTYLASSSNTLTAGGSASGFSQSSLIPGMVTTGFNVVAKPFIYADGKTMTLQFSMNLSQLLGIKEITDGTSKIQAPQVANNIIVQKVKIESGQTLIISGFESTENNTAEFGTGSAHNWLFGGGGSRDTNNTVGIVMVTPIIY